MVYTSPTKIARIINWAKQGIPRPEIAQSLGIHRTTVTRIIQRFEKSGDFYHVNPKTGRPRKFDVRDACVGARMLARAQVANVSELQKECFPDVAAQTIRRRLWEHGLVCHVCKSKPFLTPANREKRRLWALAHASWTVDDWKRVVFSDESKYMLFKSDGCQYA